MTIVFKSVSDSAAKRLSALNSALTLIVEDDDVQGGGRDHSGHENSRAADRQRAAARGVPADEPIEDYRLSQEQIAAARVYADARPQRGRPSISVAG